MDIHIEFTLAQKFQARGIFVWFYIPDHTAFEEPPTTSVISTVMDTTTTPEAHKYSLASIRSLADDFAELIPEYVVSMASIQGYLMGYKADPVGAVKGVEAWVKEQTGKDCKPAIAAEDNDDSDSDSDSD